MIDLKPACARMIDLLAGVSDDQRTDPTPCSEFTVAELIDHVDEVARGFAGVARTDSIAESLKLLAEVGDDPATWQGSTDAGGLELPNEVWGRIVLTELVVHGWDLAKATNQPFDLPEQTLRACYAHVVDFVPNAPVPSLWGPAVEVPTDAPLLARLVGITGRTP
jgi:uncharacterized protein (TIGR03086 family)